jgi:hypothetical protein
VARFPRNLHDIFQDRLGAALSAHMTTTDCIATSPVLHFFLAAGQGAWPTMRIVDVTPAGDDKAPQSCRNHAIPDG